MTAPNATSSSCAPATSSASGRCSRNEPRAASVAGRLGLHAAALPAELFRRLLDEHPDFRVRLEQRIAAVRLPPRRPRPARLRRRDPARRGVTATGLPRAGRGSSPTSPTESLDDAGAAPQKQRPIRTLPPRLPARRDGLRRGLPGDDLPPLRPRRRPLAHPPGRAHVDRRDDAGRDHARRRGARAARALGPRLEEPARRAAAARGRALGRQPLGRRSTASRASTCASPTRRAGFAGSRGRSSWRTGAATPRWSRYDRAPRGRAARRGRASPGSSRSCARTGALAVRASWLAFAAAALELVLPILTQVVVDRVLPDRRPRPALAPAGADRRRPARDHRRVAPAALPARAWSPSASTWRRSTS